MVSAPRREREVDQEQLPQQLTWLVILRVILISVLSGTTLFLHLRGEAGLLGPSVWVLWWLIGASVFASFIFYLLNANVSSGRLRWVATTQILWDIFFTTGLVYITGASSSIFTPLYIVNIAMGAIVLGRQFGYIAASLCTVFYGFLLVLEYHAILPPLLEDQALFSSEEMTRIFPSFFLNMGLFHIAAYGIGYFSEKLRVVQTKLREEGRLLAELEDLNRSILENVSSGVVTISVEGTVISLNRAAAEAIGAPVGDILGKDFGQFMPEIKQRIFSHQTPDTESYPRHMQWEYLYRRPNSMPRYLSIAVSMLKGRGYIVAIQDMTRYREMEEQMKRNDRLAAVGKLAAGIAHEIRNPLASITGSIEMLKAESKDKENRKLMEIVMRETTRLNNMISDFLEFAKPMPPSLQPVDLTTLVDETLTLFRNQFKSARIGYTPQGHYMVQADSSQIKQVLWNLLKNAEEAVGDGGEISLATGFDSATSRVYIDVRDTGAGVPMELRERIFDPFFTTKVKGSGLGLPTVAKIVAAHGGEIKLLNNRDGERGATFRVYLEAGRKAA